MDWCAIISLREEQNMEYYITLVKGDEEIPQTGLSYKTRAKAKAAVEYLNSLIPDNLIGYEYYKVDNVR